MSNNKFYECGSNLCKTVISANLSQAKSDKQYYDFDTLRNKLGNFDFLMLPFVKPIVDFCRLLSTKLSLSTVPDEVDLNNAFETPRLIIFKSCLRLKLCKYFLRTQNKLSICKTWQNGEEMQSASSKNLHSEMQSIAARDVLTFAR